MRTICLVLRRPFESTHVAGVVRSEERAREHFRERGVDAEFFYGIDAPRLGLVTTRPYELDEKFVVPQRAVGNHLSHRALWAACLLLPDDRFFLLEDDAFFPEDWRPRVDQAIADAGDFDLLYIGSCCTKGKPTRHIAGSVYEVRWPFCTHGYVVGGHRALERLLDTQDAARCTVQMDVSLVLYSMDSLRAYTVLPRILEQFDLSDLPE